MNAIQKYSIRYVVTVSDQLHRLTVIHKSSPVASWDRKVSSRCTGTFFAYYCLNTMNLDSTHTLFFACSEEVAIQMQGRLQYEFPC